MQIVVPGGAGSLGAGDLGAETVRDLALYSVANEIIIAIAFPCRPGYE